MGIATAVRGAAQRLRSRGGAPATEASGAGGGHEVAVLTAELGRAHTVIAAMQESVADLETRMYEPGWQLLTAAAEQEFTRDGLRQITAVCRVMALKNPLIKRGLGLRQAYVWGQGVSITARDSDVNAVVQGFLDANQSTLTGTTARVTLERALGTDGVIAFALFTNPRTGRVRVRVIPWDELADVVTNPDDASEPWFYRRSWVETTVDPATGAVMQRQRAALYPALGYRPLSRPARRRDTTGQLVDIVWDAPVHVLRVNGLLGWKWGVPDAYAAIDWAHAYRDFLVDWARLVKALSRFAWRLTARGSRQAQARTRLATAPASDPLTGEPRHTGATAVLAPDMALEAIPKTGATIDSESGRPLAAMVAAALDVPVTMLLGDPGTTGARATAETLDQPTELAMQLRRDEWADTYRAILRHVVLEAVRAPQGPLRGRIVRDGDTETAVLDRDADQTVDIAWPDLDDTDVTAAVEAIVKADGTERIPPEVIARLLLEALGVSDVDGILDRLTDDQGRWLGPDLSPGAAAMRSVLDRGEVPPPVPPGAGPEGEDRDDDQGGDDEAGPAPAPPPGGQRIQPRRTSRSARRR